MFTEIINKLLEMRAEEEMKLEKIDKLLAECGYYPTPVVTAAVPCNEQFIDSTPKFPEENTELLIDNQISQEYNQGEQRND